MGRSAEEFWGLTSVAFGRLVKGALRERSQRYRFHAAMTAHQVNCWLKSPVTGDRLLGIGEAGKQKRPGNRRMAWLNQSPGEMTPEQRQRLRKHLEERRAEREQQAASAAPAV